MADPWVCMEGMRWVWVWVQIIIPLPKPNPPLMGMGKKPVHTVKDSKYCHYIDTPTTTQDDPYPSLRVWVCMGMGQGRGKNTHGHQEKGVWT